jgi:hypothetical protein
MPTGTRSSISANSATNPRTADQPVGADRDQEHRGAIAGPGDREKRPGRHVHVEGEHVVVIGAAHLVEQGIGLRRHDEQQHQRCEHIDHALVFRADIGPDQVDGDVATAIAGGGDAPEDQDAEQQAPDVERIRDRIIQGVAQQDADKDVERHDADEAGGDPFDGVDETIHPCAIHVRSERLTMAGERRRQENTCRR